MDGKSEVWTCSLTRFAWHSLLFRSWIACIGLSLLLIVSFFEDCYRMGARQKIPGWPESEVWPLWVRLNKCGEPVRRSIPAMLQAGGQQKLSELWDTPRLRNWTHSGKRCKRKSWLCLRKACHRSRSSGYWYTSTAGKRLTSMTGGRWPTALFLKSAPRVNIWPLSGKSDFNYPSYLTMGYMPLSRDVSDDVYFSVLSKALTSTTRSLSRASPIRKSRPTATRVPTMGSSSAPATARRTGDGSRGTCFRSRP